MPIVMSQNYEMQGCFASESNGSNRIFAIKGIVEKGLGHLFIASSSSYFFNETFRAVSV